MFTIYEDEERISYIMLVHARCRNNQI